jgi:hypothetical protein
MNQPCVSQPRHNHRGQIALPPEGADYLCDVLVFVEESSGAVAALDTDGLEVDHPVGQRSQRRSLTQSPVRPVLIIENLIIVQQPEEVRDVPDQRVVSLSVPRALSGTSPP